MVLARVSNVKSGWKSMFMVFTTAASDESPMIVRLAFDTVEKIVREHFDYITETEVSPAELIRGGTTRRVRAGPAIRKLRNLYVELWRVGGTFPRRGSMTDDDLAYDRSSSMPLSSSASITADD